MSKTPLERKWHEALFSLGWSLPFFMPGAAQLTIVESREVQTAAVDVRGTVRLNPDFAATLSPAEVKGILAHEISHLLLGHHYRTGPREHARWNRATDRAINAILRRAIRVREKGAEVTGRSTSPHAIRLPREALFPLEPAQDTWSAEQLYQVEPPDPPGGGGGGGAGAGPPKPTGGCGVEKAPPGASDGAGSSKDPGGAGSPEPLFTDPAQVWQGIAAQSRVLARGTETGNVLVGMLDIPPARVRWQDVLRGQLAAATSAHGYDDKSFGRRSRRSGEIILPGNVAKDVRVAVIVDTSGSVPDTALARFVAEIKEISNHARVPVFLCVHDAIVQWAGWLKVQAKTEQIRSRLTGRGGTTFRPAYERVSREGRFDATIHFTDGFGEHPWPARPERSRRLIIGLFGDREHCPEPPEGARVIEVEDRDA